MNWQLLAIPALLPTWQCPLRTAIRHIEAVPIATSATIAFPEDGAAFATTMPSAAAIFAAATVFSPIATPCPLNYAHLHKPTHTTAATLPQATLFVTRSLLALPIIFPLSS